MLVLEDVWAYYGGNVALQGLSLEVQRGEIVALLGANGAGKSTTLRAIAGLLPIRRGRILFEGEPMPGQHPAEAVRRGIVLVPEGRRLFLEMSVKENLLLGAYIRRDKAAIARDLDRVASLFPALQGRWSQPAGLLSGGEQQMLAMGRALMGKPRLLLLDEPSSGLAPIVTDAILSTIAQLATEEGLTVLLVEQNAELALALANRGYVLAAGRLALAAAAEELRRDESVRRAYLGY